MVYKLDLWTFLPQWLHWYDYSPVCIFFMWNEMWTTRTALNTMTELVWLLTIVYSLMSYKVGFCSKAFFFAVTALILFLASVHSLMFFNLWFHTKALFTMVALVWFLASVYYSMYYKIRFMDKVLVTMAALVWLLTSVFFSCLTKSDLLGF